MCAWRWSPLPAREPAREAFAELCEGCLGDRLRALGLRRAAAPMKLAEPAAPCRAARTRSSSSAQLVFRVQQRQVPLPARAARRS